jgi:hypothetical protein
MSQCNADKPKCCSDTGCIAANDDCCGTEGYCPAPFRCYEWYRNNVYRGLTCCTDSSCDVYFSDGATLTQTTTAAQTVAPAATMKTTAPQLPTTTTARVETDVNYYSTTVYWSVFFFLSALYAGNTYQSLTYVSGRTTTITIHSNLHSRRKRQHECVQQYHRRPYSRAKQPTRTPRRQSFSL